ncbi:BON domain-containing protein [Rhizobium paknamense]|uniref:BON domain-containing protein n=1 Tax=Rhizobium paknamense TaxID=1206817 RepID=A0ABU0IFN8_9HYPH|nr:BON domain-containing protein [Rhizobium paknamense]MDQ0456066.1 hypothetical protein [Rhizobium paknamense]
MAHPKTKNAVAGEEDFRDQEERDLRDGWPYSDQEGAVSQPAENRAYGETPANFDRDSNPGYRVDETDADGQEERLHDRLLPETQGREDADEIESRLQERLELVDNADFSNVELHVEGHSVTMTGTVDTNEERRIAARMALGVTGIRHVINQIETLGVDTHQPDDD